jgi:hypothetical protein
LLFGRVHAETETEFGWQEVGLCSPQHKTIVHNKNNDTKPSTSSSSQLADQLPAT